VPPSHNDSEAIARAAAVLEIDLGAVVANWRLLKAKAAPAECAAVVKADGYGLGAAPVAQALRDAGCRVFFVATLDEGIGLRAALGPAPEIAVLDGPLPGTAAEFIQHGLVPVLNHPGQIEEWVRTAARSAGVSPAKSGQDGRAPEQSAPAILHIDTGMSRLGLTAREFDALLASPPAVQWRAVMSHLACADEPEHAHNPQQLQRFAAARGRLPAIPASLTASSGVFLGPAYHFDLIRPGAALYGVNPQPGGANPMRPVVRLAAKILQIREIDRGESVGYGATHVMQGPGRLATAAIGYADGWLRSFSHRGCGRIAGQRVPLVGRVSMDLASFDVSALDPALARPGGTIELLGDRYGVDEAAADAGTIGYEILTALGRRYHRVYRDAAGA
jgi:alanine racemase